LYNHGCVDHLARKHVDGFMKELNGTGPPTLIANMAIPFASIQDATNDISDDLKSCDEYKHYCNVFNMPGPIVRLYCPETCGCDNPGSALVLPGPKVGCSASCIYNPKYVRIAKNRGCFQAPDSWMISHPRFNLQLKMVHLITATKDWPGDSAQLIAGAAGLVAKLGCLAQYVFQITDGSICARIGSLRLMTWYCPATCGCNISTIPDCPTSCVIGQPVPIFSAAQVESTCAEECSLIDR